MATKPADMSPEDCALCKLYHATSLDPPRGGTISDRDSSMLYNHGGRSSIRFPSLTAAGPEMGVACRACQAFVFRHESFLRRTANLEEEPL